MTQACGFLLLAVTLEVLLVPSLADDRIFMASTTVAIHRQLSENGTHTLNAAVQPSPVFGTIEPLQNTETTSTSTLKNNTSTQMFKTQPSATIQTPYSPITQPQPQAWFTAKQPLFSVTSQTNNSDEPQLPAAHLFFDAPIVLHDITLEVLMLLNIIHILPILVTNGAVMIIIYQIKALHTPYFGIVFGLACAALLSVVDIIYSVIDYEFEIAKCSKVTCVITLSIPTFVSQNELSMLVVLCIDRFLSVHFSLWYRSHMTLFLSMLKVALVLFFEFMFSFVMLGIIFIIHYEQSNEKYIIEHCPAQLVPNWYGHTFYLAKTCIDVFMIICLSVYVTRIAWHTLDTKYKETKQTCIQAVSPWQPQKNEQIKLLLTQKQKVKTMIALIFLFFLFWLPEIIEPVVTSERDEMFRSVYRAAAKLFRRCNSSMNAFVYALSKPIFASGFKFMLSNSPCKWKHLNRHHIHDCHAEPAGLRRSSQWASRKQSLAYPKVKAESRGVGSISSYNE